MPPPPSRAALAVAAAVLLLVVAAAAQHHQDHQYDSRAAAETGQAAVVEVAPYCAGEAEECVDVVGGEAEAAAARRRRLQGGSSYVSYDAMRRNSVPCSYRGASYYNCRPGGQANPYSRGCSAITRCRG